MLSNSGQNEYGGVYGGTPGDQTGGEWNIVNWYSYPWNCVLRHPMESVRNKIADLARAAANNNKIGYNQYNRNSYWAQLQKAKYDPSKIKTACDADCSAGVIANVMATGYLLNIGALKNITATYTGNMRSAFKAAGFQVLTEAKYLNSPDYLLKGDILLNDANHTCTNLDTGAKSGSSSSTAPAKGKWQQEWFYYNANGSYKKNEWFKEGSTWYYFHEDGRAYRLEWLYYKKAWYWFKGDCKMAANEWIQDGKGWCWIDKDGKAVKSQWIKWKNGWYYIKNDYYMAANEYIPYKGKKCWVGSDGKWDGKYVS